MRSLCWEVLGCRKQVCDAICTLYKDDTSVAFLVGMQANDLDLYWGSFTTDTTKNLLVDLT